MMVVKYRKVQHRSGASIAGGTAPSTITIRRTSAGDSDLSDELKKYASLATQGPGQSKSGTLGGRRASEDIDYSEISL